MHWRFIDRVDSFEPWEAIAGTKAISFEEYSLLKPFGRKGDFPEGLVIECCVELLRWLVSASSEFRKTSALVEIRDFRLARVAKLGAVLEVAAEVEERSEEALLARCSVAMSGESVAAGPLGVSLVPLQGSFDPELVSGMWRELYGAA